MNSTSGVAEISVLIRNRTKNARARRRPSWSRQDAVSSAPSGVDSGALIPRRVEREGAQNARNAATPRRSAGFSAETGFVLHSEWRRPYYQVDGSAAFKFHEFSNHRQTRFQVSDPRIPFALKLPKGLFKVGIGGSDLSVDESFPLLQIAPDVTHGVPAICRAQIKQTSKLSKRQLRVRGDASRVIHSEL